MGRASNRKWAKRLVRMAKAKHERDREELRALFGHNKRFRRFQAVAVLANPGAR